MLSDYFSSLNGKRVSVIGAGVSNTPLILKMADAGIPVTVYDRKPRGSFDEKLYESLSSGGVSFVLGEHYLDEISGDVIFRTPGVRPDAPALLAAKARGACVTSEMDVFFRLCPCRITAVTGSDGKTTTSTLISELLKAQGFKVFLGGNIGAPLLPRLDEISENDRVVVELSSFQLMDMTRSPAVAVITNVTPNHLDYHRGMEEYTAAKYNILAHQSGSDIAVLNYDDGCTRLFGEKCTAQTRYFSVSQNAGSCLRNGSFVVCGKELFPASELKIPGMHNAANFLTACTAVCDEVSPENMRAVAQTFAGVEHRIEFVREFGGARYYNDSIGSSPTRTIAGLKCFSGRIILIAGGYDKHIAFDELGREICGRVAVLLLCGATADKIEAAVNAAGGKKPEIHRFSDLSATIQAASGLARPGDTVLFSPACASFDQFPNFMIRGNFFKEQVNNLK